MGRVGRRKGEGDGLALLKFLITLPSDSGVFCGLKGSVLVGIAFHGTAKAALTMAASNSSRLRDLREGLAKIAGVNVP
jgi:hypothetical protein